MDTTTPHPVDQFLVDLGSGAGIDPSVWSTDARLDATVPHWRFERVGADSVAAELSGWYSRPTTIDSVRRRPLPNGEAVELDLSWVEDGVPHAAHQVHLLEVDDGHIIADTVYCGGRWPADLLAEMEASRAV
jgi:hypothetical protein